MPPTQPAPSTQLPVPLQSRASCCPSRHHQSHCQQYHPNTWVIPLVAGAQRPITICPLCNHTQSATCRACGHLTSSTTQVHMVTVKRTPKLLNPTSSLVGI